MCVVNAYMYVLCEYVYACVLFMCAVHVYVLCMCVLYLMKGSLATVILPLVAASASFCLLITPAYRRGGRGGRREWGKNGEREGDEESRERGRERNEGWEGRTEREKERGGKKKVEIVKGRLNCVP
jgi:hypothetical protein